MTAKFTLLTLFIYTFFSASAQQPAIPNGGFENWNDSVPSYPISWDSPDDLIHKLSAGIPQMGWCTKDTVAANVFAGNSSCRLRNDSVAILSQLVPGAVSSGQLGFNGSAPVPIGLPFTGRPAVFSGSLKYQPVGLDKGQYQVYLSKWDAVGDSEIVIVYDQKLVTNTSGGFVTFNDTLHYMSSETPDTIVIAFLAGLGDSTTRVGSILWVDDLSFQYLSTGIRHLDIDDAIKIYPNPTANTLNITVDNYMTGYTFNVYDLSGRLVKTAIIESAGSALNIAELADGAYIYYVRDKAGKEVHQSKFNVLK